MSNIRIPYSVLCELILSSVPLEQGLKERFPELEDPEKLSITVSEFRSRFEGNFQRKWRDSSRNIDYFSKKNADWLKRDFIITFSSTAPPPAPENKGGRPTKCFADCKRRNQLSRISALREEHSQELIDAAASKPKKQQKAAFDCDQALAIMVQAKLSKYQYEIIRTAIRDLGFSIFPSYKKVLEAKKKCYPEDVKITDISAEVPLQSLLDHTAHRLFLSRQHDEIESWEDDLVLHTKWGLDGASDQGQYMQQFSTNVLDMTSDEENSNQDPNGSFSDSHMFMTSLVPLQLSSSTDVNNVIWKNEKPNSTRYCRALKFQFRKETPELISEEKHRVDEEIKNLTPSTVILGSRSFRISHSLYFTMIDGKVAQVVTETPSASNCVVCGAKPSALNDLANFGIHKKEEVLRMGMSTLHARIKFMEYVLHLGYNHDFKAWRTTKETRALREASQERIKRQLWEDLGIRVDTVKQGSGTTNTGNASRRFFQDSSKVVEITKVDEALIIGLRTILEVLCSQSEIDVNRFRLYARETAEIAVTKYNWYYLSATVHKILFHGAEMIQAAALPIGSLSEEAQESRNKDYKFYREHHSRKCSRVSTNEDVFNFIMVSSDPMISNLRPELSKKKNWS